MRTQGFLIKQRKPDLNIISDALAKRVGEKNIKTLQMSHVDGSLAGGLCTSLLARKMANADT